MSDDRVPSGDLAPLLAGRAGEHGERSFAEETATGRRLSYQRLGQQIGRAHV